VKEIEIPLKERNFDE